MAVLKRTMTAAGLMVLLAASGTAQAEVASEYAVKAAFLFNFTKFVEWPPSAFGERNDFQLCVLGEDPFGKGLDVVRGEKVAGREITLLRTPKLAEEEGCQILFISRSERARMPQILQDLKDAPVLTVADTDGFLDDGGIINFKLEGSKVRFEINQQAADRAGIKISSKLLRLAVAPKGSPGP
jgi:YfiR/HmsC-like